MNQSKFTELLFSPKPLKLLFSSAKGKFCTIAVLMALSAWPILSVKSGADLEGRWAMIVALLPSLFILVYGLVACGYVKYNVLIAGDSIADFTYFLGYLGTITAVTALVTRLGNMEDGFNISTITVSIGIALTTTIAGLVFMTLIREVQQVQPIDTVARKEIAERLEEVVSDNRTAFKGLSVECQRIQKELAQTREAAGALATTIDGCKTSINDGKTKFNEYVKTAGGCIDIIQGVSNSIKTLSEYQVPADTLQALKNSINEISTLNKKCKTAAESVLGFSESIGICDGKVSSMSSRVSANTDEMNSFYKAVGQLQKVLDEYARLTEKRIRAANDAPPLMTHGGAMGRATQDGLMDTSRKHGHTGEQR